MNSIFFGVSVLVGAPLGGLLGETVDALVLYRRMGIAVEIAGAVIGALLMYTFILLHNQRR